MHPLVFESCHCVEEELVADALLNEVSAEILLGAITAEHTSAIAAQQEHRSNIELQAVRSMLFSP